FVAATSPTGDDVLFGDGGKVEYNGRIITLAATIAPLNLGGNDTMFGNAGNDVEFGGPGEDVMNGGHGAGASVNPPASDKDVLVGDNGQVNYGVDPNGTNRITIIKTTDG